MTLHIRSFFLAAVFTLTSSIAVGAGFSNYDDHRELIDSQIVSIGVVEEAHTLQPQGSRSGAKLYMLGEDCFFLSFSPTYSAAMIVVDKWKYTKLAIFSSRYSSEMEVKMYPVTLKKCSDFRLDKGEQLLKDVQKMREDMDARQKYADDLKKQLEQQRSRQK